MVKPGDEPGAEAADEALFEDRPRRLALYRAFRDRILALGDDVEIVPKNTQVTFRTTRAFAWAWTPQPWDDSRPPDCIVVTFGADHPVHDPRIAESTQVGDVQWTHHVVIEADDEIDDVVRGWFTEAYARAAQRTTRRNRR